MKTALTVIAFLVSTSTAFAGSKDLRAMKTLEKAGVTSSQFMSQTHIGLDDVQCAMTNETQKFVCTMNDISADDGEGAELVFKGKKAQAIFNILAAFGAQGDAGMGKTYLSAQTLRCTQAVSDVADGSPAARTECYIEN